MDQTKGLRFTTPTTQKDASKRRSCRIKWRAATLTFVAVVSTAFLGIVYEAAPLYNCVREEARASLIKDGVTKRVKWIMP